MALLIVEIALLVKGLIGLVSGRLSIRRGVVVEGTRARLASLLLIAPVPFELCLGFSVGVLMGLGVIGPVAPFALAVAEFAIVLGCIFCAYAVAQASRSTDSVASPQ
jgi:hypothetical protein